MFPFLLCIVLSLFVRCTCEFLAMARCREADRRLYRIAFALGSHFSGNSASEPQVVQETSRSVLVRCVRNFLCLSERAEWCCKRLGAGHPSRPVALRGRSLGSGATTDKDAIRGAALAEVWLHCRHWHVGKSKGRLVRRRLHRSAQFQLRGIRIVRGKV